MLVYVVEPLTLVRQGLESLLANHCGAEVRGCGTPSELHALLEERQPDLVMTEFPAVGGADFIRGMTADHPDLAVLVVAAADGVETIREAIKAGAAGFLPKAATVDQLRAAVSVVGLGSTYLPERTAARFLAPVDAQGDLGLTKRERQVLLMVVGGNSNSQIARTLHMSQSTVKAHLRSLFQKLEVDDRVSLAVVAVRRGLVDDSGGRAAE